MTCSLLSDADVVGPYLGSINPTKGRFNPDLIVLSWTTCNLSQSNDNAARGSRPMKFDGWAKRLILLKSGDLGVAYGLVYSQLIKFLIRSSIFSCLDPLVIYCPDHHHRHTDVYRVMWLVQYLIYYWCPIITYKVYNIIEIKYKIKHI